MFTATAVRRCFRSDPQGFQTEGTWHRQGLSWHPGSIRQKQSLTKMDRPPPTSPNHHQNSSGWHGETWGSKRLLWCQLIWKPLSKSMGYRPVGWSRLWGRSPAAQRACAVVDLAKSTPEEDWGIFWRECGSPKATGPVGPHTACPSQTPSKPGYFLTRHCGGFRAIRSQQIFNTNKSELHPHPPWVIFCQYFSFPGWRTS